jgi:hypothetical protein
MAERSRDRRVRWAGEGLKDPRVCHLEDGSFMIAHFHCQPKANSFNYEFDPGLARRFHWRGEFILDKDCHWRANIQTEPDVFIQEYYPSKGK